jgi:Holliday junction resolvase RusA-like endonuclease
VTLRFTVLGVARPQGSMRAFKPKGLKFPVLTSMAKGLGEWKRNISASAAAALAGSRAQPFPAGPVSLDVTFYLPRPKKFQTKKYAALDVPILTTPDVDKLVRAAMDGLTAVVWHDDKQVTEVTGRKKYCADGEMPRAEIAVSSVSVSMVAKTWPTLFGREGLDGKAREGREEGQQAEDTGALAGR